MERDFLRYDGTFPGLIRALGPWLKRRELPTVIERAGCRQPSLFGDHLEMTAEASNDDLRLVPTAEDFAAVAMPEVTMTIWRRVWVAFLAEVTGIERQVGEYLLLAVERGNDIEDLLTDPRVQRIQRCESRVRREVHAFKGLLRFQQIEERLFLAVITPETCILPMIAPHFARRFADQAWIIHDRRRKLAAVCEQGTVTLVPQWAAEETLLQQTEQEMQELWRCFFRQAAVRERLNLAAQQRHIPRRYWNDLIEEPGRE
ncbi:MAG TPA: TIGR03915 family putative DNA repair protein [Candidatus Ozemobacteraceae bacterium]|nr:TIGR03915 family putative DNA repair protein [Candidatus Ozemobacteraceae bacterium]